MMKRVVGVLLLAGYLATGFYLVRGNEVAVVRRCGRVVRGEDGTTRLHPSGLHYDLPWPLAVVDRVNLHAAQSLPITPVPKRIEGSETLLADDSADQLTQFLTGDRNILHLDARVTYRIAQSGVSEFLFSGEQQGERLALIGEAELADVVARSGVDFVHTFGRTELRSRLLEAIQRRADEAKLGVVIDDVTIENVAPPIRVKADFLDVMNARADKASGIQQARGDADRRLQAAQAKTLEKADAAAAERTRRVANARADAERLIGLIAQIEGGTAGQERAAARAMTLNRYYIATAREVLPQVAEKVFVEAGQTVDLTIVREPEE